METEAPAASCASCAFWSPHSLGFDRGDPEAIGACTWNPGPLPFAWRYCMRELVAPAATDGADCVRYLRLKDAEKADGKLYKAGETPRIMDKVQCPDGRIAFVTSFATRKDRTAVVFFDYDDARREVKRVPGWMGGPDSCGESAAYPISDLSLILRHPRNV